MEKLTKKALKLVDELISGTKNPIEVALWAEKFDHPENEKLSEEIQAKYPVLREFIDTLSLAGAIDEKGTLIYGVVDFKNWKQEFTEHLSKGNK